MPKSVEKKRTSPWPRREERERERMVKRDAVLHAAVEMFNEKGFHSTSLDEVALALNVTKPTIYHYFDSKDEILFECVRLGLQGVSEAIERVEAAGGAGIERLRALIHEYVIIMTHDFGKCITRTADHELSPTTRAEFRRLKREIDAAVRRVIKEGMEDGSICPGDPRLVTFCIAGALNWVARWYEEDGTLRPEDIADGYAATLINGLAPRIASSAAV